MYKPSQVVLFWSNVFEPCIEAHEVTHRKIEGVFRIALPDRLIIDKIEELVQAKSVEASWHNSNRATAIPENLQ